MKLLDLSYRIAGGEVLKLLDLFCGGGGAAMGYSRAGFDVTGIDNRPQPRYPFTFIQADALEYVREHGHEYDAIHASPPCQAYSRTQVIWGREYPELVAPTREALRATGKPYVIENVVGAPLENAGQLCGTMFGLRTYRHRLFETSFFMLWPSHNQHKNRAAKVGRYPKPDEFLTVAGHFGGAAIGREVMQIDWMTRDELAQAIPPAYCEFIGRRLLEAVAA